MARLLIGICLLTSAALCVAQAPPSGRYGAELSIASDSEQIISGWLDRRLQMPDCGVYLYAQPNGSRWRLLAYAPLADDLVVGTLEAEGRTLRIALPRAPRGCEQRHQDFVEGREYSLSQPRNWQRIALPVTPTTPIRERADPEAAIMGELDAGSAWAVTASRGTYSAGLVLRADGGEAGWVATKALAPAVATASMRARLARPLPGLSAPASMPERAQWMQMLDWSSECEARFQANSRSDGGIALIQIAPQFALLRIDCGDLSYQESFIYAWIRFGAPEQTRLLLLPGYAADRGESRVSSDHSLVFGLDEVDPTAQTLTLFSKWRSPGDCGQLLRFALKIDGPELSEWRVRSCELEPEEDPVSPLEWPLKEGTPGAE